MNQRETVSDYIESMLKEEIVYICPLGLSKNCLENPISHKKNLAYDKHSNILQNVRII